MELRTLSTVNMINTNKCLMEWVASSNWLYSQQCRCIGMHADCRDRIGCNPEQRDFLYSPLDTRNVLSIA